MEPSTNPELPPIFQPEALNPHARYILGWFSRQPIITSLLVLMLLDILSGVCVAASKQKLSSSVSWRGMSKKVIMLLLVGVAAVLEPFANGIPLSKLVATFYMVTEAISILENAASAGVPLPRVLVDTLVKLRADRKVIDSGGGTPPPGGSSTIRLEGELHTTGTTATAAVVPVVVPVTFEKHPETEGEVGSKL